MTQGASKRAMRPLAEKTARRAATSRTPSGPMEWGARAERATMALTTGGERRSSRMAPATCCRRLRTQSRMKRTSRATAVPASRTSKVSRLLLGRTRSKTWSMNNDGTMKSRFMTKEKTNREPSSGRTPSSSDVMRPSLSQPVVDCSRRYVLQWVTCVRPWPPTPTTGGEPPAAVGGRLISSGGQDEVRPRGNDVGSGAGDAGEGDGVGAVDGEPRVEPDGADTEVGDGDTDVGRESGGGDAVGDEIDLILAACRVGVEVEDDVGLGAGVGAEDEDVVGAAAGEGVVAGPAREAVGGRAAVEGVVVSAAVEVVLAVAAVEGVVTALAVDCIGAAARVDGVGAA